MIIITNNILAAVSSHIIFIKMITVAVTVALVLAIVVLAADVIGHGH